MVFRVNTISKLKEQIPISVAVICINVEEGHHTCLSYMCFCLGFLNRAEYIM